MQGSLGDKACTEKCCNFLYLTIKISIEYSKSQLPWAPQALPQIPCVPFLIIQLGLSPALHSLSSPHFDMLRSSASVVGELGPVSDPDLNFNSLKKHAVLHRELSK